MQLQIHVDEMCLKCPSKLSKAYIWMLQMYWQTVSYILQVLLMFYDVLVVTLEVNFWYLLFIV